MGGRGVDGGWATRIRGGADAWRALAPQARAAVRRAARRRESASDVDTAVAAVEYGRFLRRRWGRVAGGLAVVEFALLGVGGWVRERSAALVLVTVLLGVVGCAAVVALALSGRGPGRLIAANLGLAASRATGAVRPQWRVGSRRPKLLFTLVLLGWPVGVVALFVWRQFLPDILASIAFVATVARGPSWSGLIRAATMSAAGVDLPTWRARIPWTSVSGVDLDPIDGTLQIRVGGPFEVTGSLPRAWARPVAVALQPGKTIKLMVADPELGLWTARHHLTADRVTT